MPLSDPVAPFGQTTIKYPDEARAWSEISAGSASAMFQVLLAEPGIMKGHGVKNVTLSGTCALKNCTYLRMSESEQVF
jgi:hypothetical protein